MSPHSCTGQFVAVCIAVVAGGLIAVTLVVRRAVCRAVCRLVRTAVCTAVCTAVSGVIRGVPFPLEPIGSRQFRYPIEICLPPPHPDHRGERGGQTHRIVPAVVLHAGLNATTLVAAWLTTVGAE